MPPTERILCFCYKCVSTYPDGRDLQRKTVLRHQSDAKKYLATLQGQLDAAVWASTIRSVDRGIKCTAHSIAGIPQELEDEPEAEDEPKNADLDTEMSDPTFSQWEITAESNNFRDSEIFQNDDYFGTDAAMDLDFDHLANDLDFDGDSDSQSIISAKRELLVWDSEESDSDEGHSSSHFHDLCPHAPSPTFSHDDIDSDSEEDPAFTTPALQQLKKELLSDYKAPKHPPSEPFARPILTYSQQLSLKHYAAWHKSNGTIEAYKSHASVLSEATNAEILSLYKVESLADSLTHLSPRNIDMCPKSCIAYTGKYSHLKKCEYVSSATREPCNTKRYNSRRQPNAQYTVLSVKATLDALFANAETSSLMRHRDNCKQAVLNLLGNASNSNQSQRTYSDFGDSFVHTEIHNQLAPGLFKNPRNVAFGLSTDGAQLTMKKQSNTWILILIILNLPPEMRYKSENVIINFATPGPNSPGDIESFIRPLFEEMAQGSEGIWIWDALDSAYFLIKHCIAIGAGDMLGSAKINGMAGHAAIYGDRFSTVQAAKSSTSSGSKAQYYPILTSSDIHNPNRPQYSYDKLPMRQHLAYFKTLQALEAAGNENRRRNITKATGVSRLPLLAASPAFFHPTFFPLDPFHLIYENCMAFIWDLWTIHSVEGEIMHISAEKAANLGRLIPEAMATLPPSFCGPIRDPFLKRQSQYKVFEWMALLHWYLIPMGLELGLNSLILENFSNFVRAMDFAMTNKARSDDDLARLHSLIAQFLTDFERLYIGDNPNHNNRARLCLFQLIHIPIHIKWNGSIRVGSQATVERAIGEMGHKIRSKKSPFANLRNLIIRRERIKLLRLYYPELSLQNSTSKSLNQTLPNPDLHLFKKVPIRVSDCEHGTDTYNQMVHIVNLLRNSGVSNSLHLESFERYGKLKLLNGRSLHSELAYSCSEKGPARKSCWFRGEVQGTFLFGEALAFYKVQITNTEARAFVVFKMLMDVQEVLGIFRGRQWSATTDSGIRHIIAINNISDLIGIWSTELSGSQWIYVLQKHPGLDMLEDEESGREIDSGE